MSEWKNVKVEDILLVPSRNGLTKPSAIRGEGVKMIAMGELFAHPIIRDIETDRVPVTEKELQSSNIEVDDLLFARQSLTLEGAGKCSIVKVVNEPTVFESHLIRLRINKKLADPLFVYYYFNSYHGKHSIQNIVNQVAAAGIKGSDLVKLVIPLPPLDVQKKISSFLYNYDDKIAVNRRICENLEAQAQALFKHWFIDFAPFKNGKFVESELGMIPEGWRVRTLGEIAEINPSRTIKKGTTATYLDMKNMPTSGSFPIKWEDKEFTGGMKFKNGDTLMARITPCLENGKVAYVNFLKDGEIAFGSTEYIVMTAKESIFPELLYTLCRFPSFVNYAVKNMNGSSGRQRVSGETISNYRLVIAPEVVYSSVRPIFQEYMLQIRECGFENLRLSTLRDALLPKLMSGELKVNAIETKVV